MISFLAKGISIFGILFRLDTSRFDHLAHREQIKFISFISMSWTDFLFEVDFFGIQGWQRGLKSGNEEIISSHMPTYLPTVPTYRPSWQAQL